MKATYILGIDAARHKVRAALRGAGEERFLLIGLSGSMRLLVVVHCETDSGDLIRLISARRATRSERAQYDARWKR